MILLDTHAWIRWLHPEVNRKLPDGLRAWLESADAPFAVSVISALEVAQLVKKGMIDGQLCKRLTGEEKLYLKCLEVESHGDYRSGVFQEFARGFGVRDYRFMLQSGKANQTRLKTASEFKRCEWGTEGFGSSLLRHALFAAYQTADQDSTRAGLNYLKTELRDYWAQRENLAGLLRFIGRLPIPHWAPTPRPHACLPGRWRTTMFRSGVVDDSDPAHPR